MYVHVAHCAISAMTARATLRSGGVTVPLLGLGTFKIRDEQTISSVIDTALDCGYRLIVWTPDPSGRARKGLGNNLAQKCLKRWNAAISVDEGKNAFQPISVRVLLMTGNTAAVYRNEKAIGDALKELSRKHRLNPEDIFITSKLAPCDHGYERTFAALESSLLALGRPYLDLYLIHWPGVQGRKREDPQNTVLRRESWRALEELYKKGKVKAIGISNYTVKHLEELRQYATIQPQVLQSECHPFLSQKELRSYCEEKGIFFQAYSSLGTGELLSNDDVISVASHYQKTPPQLLLRWGLQQGLGVIPKSSNPVHVKENAAIFEFEITPEDMDSLNCLDKGYHFCWDPTGVA